MRYVTKPILAQLVTMEVLYFLFMGVCYLIWPTSHGTAFLPLLILYPLLVFVIPLYSVASRGYNPVWPWATFVLFLPPMFTIFNSSALIYGVAYTVISAVGCILGVLVYHRITKPDEAAAIGREQEPMAV